MKYEREFDRVECMCSYGPFQKRIIHISLKQERENNRMLTLNSCI